MQTNYQLKQHNTIKIFKTLQRFERISRKDVAKETGLSWGSVSAIIGDLIAKEIVVAQKEASDGGRPAETLSIRPDTFLSLGVDINSVGLSFVIVNMQGKAICSQSLPMESRKKEEILALLFSKTQELLSLYPNVIGISLSMQGLIDKTAGVSVRANFSDDWKNVPLVALFESRFALPTALYHDPDCLLYYHLYRDARLKDKKDGFVIRLDNGIGMARLLHGKLYNPSENGAYEFGQIIAVPNGKECSFGQRGCLEAYSSIRGMMETYAKLSGNSEQSFLQKLQTNDAQALQILDEGTQHLAVAISNLFTLSAPQFVLLDGVLLSFAPQLFTQIENKVRFFKGEPCKLLCAHYTKEAPAIGACLITLEEKIQEILFPL